jgi:hypothetical protein
MIEKHILGALALTLATFGCGAAPSDGSLATDDAELRGGFDPRLAHYQETYFRWFFGDKTLPTDANGNSVEKNVVMMPIPPTPGDGTPGTAEVTLSAGEGFVLPLQGALGNGYRDGTPPDPFEPLSVITTLDIQFSVDGQTLIETSNVSRYISKFTFEPAILIDDPVFASVIWYEGAGVLHAPLCPGKHVLKLDTKNTEPIFGAFVEFHNTWNVTVKPGK